ncbi:4166_t:CDS:2 [Paraglomus brasilianum]|uniref:4166_t:CDS:1 n=1 Tax=Paraglomus brasilianum TaxID=144538 RepID=A0A9N9DYB1_9GLOM|nr:4166_t:CDS:2 [Paraglomus brasilianum]
MSSTTTVGRIICFIGFIFLAHASYSTYEHLSYLKAVERVERELPLDIKLETLSSVAIFSLGVALVAGSLKEIYVKSEMAKKTIDLVDTRPSFIIFNHRGRVVKKQ